VAGGATLSANVFDTETQPQVRSSSTHSRKPSANELSVVGTLPAAGNEVTLTPRPTIRHTGERLHVDASTIDDRDLGMTWSPLGMAETPTTITVHAELSPAG
jgi:polyisoprenoid-binding protein YceI